jgi:HAD superfamily hydrolase (TIGR01549 family)
MGRQRVPLFDLDGTLVDSDLALTEPFAALGIDPERIPLGLPVAEACDLAGVALEDYLDRYDPDAVEPFPGVADLVAELDRWAVCSNKASRSARHELLRLGWSPEVAMFSEDFGGGAKRLGPVLAALDLAPRDAVFVGDTAHDRECAAQAGVTFALAGWNARAVAEPTDVVLVRPLEVLDLL